MESWLAQPVWRKLLGVGPGMMHTAVADWAGAGITDRMKTFYAAHNEYLELLLTTDLQIQEIARRCGYTDQHYFSYCFKKYSGTSPVALRRARAAGEARP